MAATLALHVAVTRAAPLTYGVDAGVAESDNVTLAHTDKVSQTIAVADVDFAYKQRSLLLDADAKGNFSYLDYLQDAYHNELLGRFDGTATLALIPQQLTWTLQDAYGKAAIDPFTPTTPTNLESINYVATGPDLKLRIGGTGFVNMTARVAETQYETSPFSNTRALATVAWGDNVSAFSSVSVNVDDTRVFFRNTLLNEDFNRTEAFLRYAVSGARTQLSADLGGTRVTERSASPTGGLVKLMLTRVLSPAASLKVSAGRDLSDASTSFSTPSSAGVTNLTGAASAVVTSETYTSTYAAADWQYVRNRTTLSVDARWERDAYAGQAALNRSITNLGVTLARQLTRSLNAQLNAQFFKVDYPRAGIPVAGSPDTDNALISAALTWRHGRALEVRLRGEHSSFTTSPNDTGYRENRIYLSVGYRPFKEQPSAVPDGSLPQLPLATR